MILLRLGKRDELVVEQHFGSLRLGALVLFHLQLSLDDFLVLLIHDVFDGV